MKSEMMDRLTEDVGGFNNAFTNDDVTVYFEVVPSNYLETLLWAEAERLSGLNVDDPNFKSERDVVKEEFRQGVLAPPYGRFEYLLQQKSFARTSLQTAHDWQHRRSRRCIAQRRTGVSCDLLSSGQCDAGSGWRFRAGAARCVGRQILWSNCKTGAAASACAGKRTAAQKRNSFD